jgi:hypothetical protein
MASAGVVGMAEVVTPTSAGANSSLSGSPAMWSYIWVGAAVLFLMFVHTAMRGAR